MHGCRICKVLMSFVYVKKLELYSLPAVVLPAAVHSLQEGKVVQRLCERPVKFE